MSARSANQSSFGGESSSAARSDRRLLLGLSAVMVLLIVGVSVFAPQESPTDARPTTTNRGPDGAKAAYLTLQQLGWHVVRWSQPLQQLAQVDAAHTTLVLAEPEYAATDRDRLAAQLKAFLQRGGRVLTTGAGGALLLPGGATSPAGLFSLGLCQTTAEGQSELARAGSVALKNGTQWSATGPQFVVDQRCGREAVVVHLTVTGPQDERGEAVWWSRPDPMRNRQLGTPNDLRLLLASLGSDGQRTILFDDDLHLPVPSPWDVTGGLPLGWLAAQAALLFGLLVFSFSRRNGPVRLPVALPRSSPAEFAHSMGDLYARGRATSAATDAARRRLLRIAVRQAGVTRTALQLGPTAVADALAERLGGSWSHVGQHLQAAQDAAREPLSERAALALAQALYADAKAIQAAAAPRALPPAPDSQPEAAAELAGMRE